MSLVQAVITDNFILVGADKRGILKGIEIYEECNKVIKLNKGIIFGITGGLFDNYKLFNGFCNCSNETGILPITDDNNITYNDFVKIISDRYEEMKIEHDDIENPVTYDIESIICGFNGEKLEVTTFALGSKHGTPDGILKVHKAPDFPYKGVSAGMKEHLDYLHELVGITYHKYGNITMRQYKNIMLDVFENGIVFDETINTNVCFEKIRKKDVMIE